MIELSSIYHRTTDNYCYLLNEKTLQLRIRTKKGNVDTIEVVYGDQYKIKDHKWAISYHAMNKMASDSLHDYWEVTINTEDKRIRYGFILKGEEQQVTYTEKGFHAFIPEDPGFYFCYPYIHHNEIFDPPEWVQHTVWYQVFPDRFRNGNPSLNSHDTLSWNQEDPSFTNYFGGDIQGIIDALPYLENLGITGIYLTPIFFANSNHKYNTINYLEVDPHFGDIETLKSLVTECHRIGIRVMLDAVFNHCGYDFPPFQDVLKNGENSIYKDWFHIHQFPIKDDNSYHYETFGYYEDMPKLNTSNAEVKEYLLEVATHWIKECDIDGWRLDVANEIDHIFWREFRTTVKTLKPDLFILGEVWHDSMPWLRGDQFDSVMNYPVLSKTLQFFAYNMISTKSFVEDMTSIYYLYPKSVNQILFTIIGSHDTPRVLNEAHFRKEKVRLLFTFLLTFPGTPCIYYGDEIGLDGGSDPGCRKCMKWDSREQDLELKDFVKKLISIRKATTSIINSGDFCFLPFTQNCIAYSIHKEKEIIVTIINNSPHTEEYALPFSLKGKKLSLLLTDQQYAAESDDLTVTLSAYESSILHFTLK